MTPLYSVISLKLLSSGDYRFTVTQRTSLGLNYYHGFRFMRDGRLLPPSIPWGVKYKAIVQLPDAALAAIRKQVLVQVIKEGRADPVCEDKVFGGVNDTDSAMARDENAVATTVPP